jgi:hypothetical protein
MSGIFNKSRFPHRVACRHRLGKPTQVDDVGGKKGITRADFDLISSSNRVTRVAIELQNLPELLNCETKMASALPNRVAISNLIQPRPQAY